MKLLSTGRIATLALAAMTALTAQAQLKSA